MHSSKSIPRKPWSRLSAFKKAFCFVLMSCTLSVLANPVEAILLSLPKYDNIRENMPDSNVTRIENVDVVTSTNGQNLSFCHLAVMLPFSQIPPGAPGRVPFPHGYESAFAASLAAHHLNTGDGTVVPEVAGLNNRCNVRFTVEFFDTELSQSRAVKEVISILDRKPPLGRLPSAFIGNTRSAVSMATSVVTGLAGYPQISPISVSSELDDRSQHPLFGRNIPSTDGFALPIVRFFREILDARHLGIVHNNDGYGNAYARAVLKAAQEYAPDLKIKFIDIPVQAKPEDYAKAISFLKSTKFRFFFATVLNINYEPLMEEAYHQSIAGNGLHNWMFSTSIERALKSQYDRGSPLHLATKGVTMINIMGGKSGMPVHDAFEKSWNDLNNPDDIAYISSKLPQYINEPDYDNTAFISNAFFDTKGGTVGPFVYDVAVSLGLAACAAAGKKGETESLHFDGPSHFHELLDTTFEGATGKIVLEKDTASRDPSSALFELLNVVEDRNYETNEKVHMIKNRPYIFEDAIWNKVAPLLFNDGTGTVPLDIPTMYIEYNYIGNSLRGICLTLSGLIMILSLLFAVWTHIKSKTRVVRASQPIFLLILCFGIFLMGSAIIPLSFDDEVTSVRGCSISCMLTPWLFFIGFATSFSALLSKTWRVNKVFNHPALKRIKILPLDVMKPLFTSLAGKINTRSYHVLTSKAVAPYTRIYLLSNYFLTSDFLLVTIVVLSIWTSLSPIRWHRDVAAVDEFGRAISSRGSCKSNSYLPYMIILVVVNASVLVCAIYQAYKARTISTEFAESEYIAKALALTMIVCLVAIPVLLIVNDNPRASFFVVTSVITVLCTSLLLFIFVPKVIFDRELDNKGAKKGQLKNQRQNIRSSVMRSTSRSEEYKSEIENGMVIVNHPKMREQMRVENEELKKRVSELETLLKAKRQEEHYKKEEEKGMSVTVEKDDLDK